MWLGRSLTLAALFASLCSGQGLEDAVRTLGKSVAARLAPSEVAHLTTRNVSSLSVAEVTKAQAGLERALRRRVRSPITVEITVTISENLKGYLLVAEIHRGNERVVEMASFRPASPVAPARSAIVIEKRLIWEQDAPILDVAVTGDRMLVLDPAVVTRYEHREGKWERAEQATLSIAPVRDPRGRLEVAGDSVTVWSPGGTCRGSSKPLELHCDPSTAEFMVGQYAVRFTASRNTLEASEWPSGGFETWGSDFAPIATACGGQRIAPSGTGAWDAADFIALYEVAGGAPVRIGDAVEFPGPVLALWPASAGALAVARNLATKRYEAYSLTVDCGR